MCLAYVRQNTQRHNLEHFVTFARQQARKISQSMNCQYTFHVHVFWPSTSCRFTFCLSSFRRSAFCRSIFGLCEKLLRHDMKLRGTRKALMTSSNDVPVNSCSCLDCSQLSQLQPAVSPAASCLSCCMKTMSSRPGQCLMNERLPASHYQWHITHNEPLRHVVPIRILFTFLPA